jgi:O-acetyl-ADP-ribose deacetylase (regulator of RNase III)
MRQERERIFLSGQNVNIFSGLFLRRTSGFSINGVSVSVAAGDLTEMKVDAIVNTVKPGLIGGSSYVSDLDGQVCEKAGPEIGDARRRHGVIAVGDVVVTPGFGLPCRHVFHVTGPIYKDGQSGEVEALKGLYEAILTRAVEMRLNSLLLPVISSGPYVGGSRRSRSGGVRGRRSKKIGGVGAVAMTLLWLFFMLGSGKQDDASQGNSSSARPVNSASMGGSQ